MARMKPRKLGGPHDVLARMMSEIGHAAGHPDGGVELAAEFEGVSKFTLYKQLDPDNLTGGEMSFVRVWRLCGRFGGRAVAEAFAALCGCRLVPLPPVKAAEMDLRAVNNLQRESSEAIGAILDAKADGRISQAEARVCREAALRMADAAMEAAARMEAVLQGEGE